jgi:hypothetical protein
VNTELERNTTEIEIENNYSEINHIKNKDTIEDYFHELTNNIVLTEENFNKESKENNNTIDDISNVNTN